MERKERPGGLAAQCQSGAIGIRRWRWFPIASKDKTRRGIRCEKYEKIAGLRKAIFSKSPGHLFVYWRLVSQWANFFKGFNGGIAG